MYPPDRQLQRWIVQNNASQLRERNLRVGVEVGFSGGKQNITHVDHETATGVGRWKHAIELLKKPLAKLLLLLFGSRLLSFSLFPGRFLGCDRSIRLLFGFRGRCIF